MGMGSKLIYERNKDTTSEDTDKKKKKKKGKNLSIEELKAMGPEAYEKYCRNQGW